MPVPPTLSLSDYKALPVGHIKKKKKNFLQPSYTLQYKLQNTMKPKYENKSSLN